MSSLKNIGNNGDMSFSDANFDYDYPNGLDLHPDSELHRRLVEEILSVSKSAYDVISERFDTWRELDRKLTVYVELDEEDEEVQGEDKSKPVAIVVPITYATRETLLTYWTAAFMKHPIFRYEPSRDPNDTLGVLLLENIIEQDCIRSKVGLALYTMWSDAFTYGFGAVSPTWRREEGFRTKYIDVTEKSFMGFPTKKRTIKSRESVLQFEGNDLIVLDPYNCLPDPNVPVQNVKDMDFFGWTDRTTYNKLLTEERLSEGEMFNVKYVGLISNKSSRYFSADDTETGRYDKSGINFGKQPVTKHCDIITMYMWIVPSDFGLSDSDYPEIWKFVLAADRVIIEARPLGLDHNRIPVAVMAPHSDGHTTLPVSILEREYPLQHAIDWLWKSHVANVRKAINNMLVVDPSLVNINDLTDTRFGMLARLRAAAWGRGVNDAVQQLQVTDVTKGHINDIGFLMNIDNLVFTSNQAKGVQDRRGERVSAQEARDTRMSFLSKMEKDAKIGAMQAHYEIAHQFASNTIQLLEEERYIKLTGDYKRVLQNEYGIEADYLVVEPRALDIRFDVVPQDGSIPGGEYADVWERLMSSAASNPDIFEHIDFVKVWLHIARLLGAKNAGDFLKTEPNTRVANYEEINKGLQRGNIVPLSQLEGASNE